VLLNLDNVTLLFLYQTPVIKLGYVNFMGEIEKTRKWESPRDRQLRSSVGGESSCPLLH
jgi:hypothetical protein